MSRRVMGRSPRSGPLITNRSTVSGIPDGTVASRSWARMCSRRSYPIRGNASISLAMITGIRPAASTFANAAFTPRNAKMVKISRPPGLRCRGAPAITRSSSSQPSGPPLSAAAAASSPLATRRRRHLRRIRADQVEALAGDRRIAVAEARIDRDAVERGVGAHHLDRLGQDVDRDHSCSARAASTAARPSPPPISSTRSPGCTTR